MFKKIIIQLYWNILFRILKLLPIQKKVFFESFLGKSYSDSPKAICEKMIEMKLDYKYIWSMRDPSAITNKEITSIKKMSFAYLYHLATAKYIVNNSRMPLYFSKRKGQVFIQTWHGTPLKRLVHDMDKVTLPGVNKDNYLKNFDKDVALWDYLISPNEFATRCFLSGFKYKGKILEYGYPRNERLSLSTQANIDEIKKKLNIPLANKVILYAPTFRDDSYAKKGHYIQNIDINFADISTNTTFIIRNHYLVKEVNYVHEPTKNVIDLSDYDDINDLFLISDILITDYSSVFFDFLELKRPIIFYQYDQEKYTKELRGYYLSLDDLPGDIVKDNKMLIKAIETTSTSKQQQFINKYKLKTQKQSTSEKIIRDIFI